MDKPMTISALKPPTKSTKPALKPPRYLKKAGRELWLSVASAFVLEQHDVTLLTALCETLDRKNQAENELRKAKAQLSRTAMGSRNRMRRLRSSGTQIF